MCESPDGVDFVSDMDGSEVRPLATDVAKKVTEEKRRVGRRILEEMSRGVQEMNELFNSGRLDDGNK